LSWLTKDCREVISTGNEFNVGVATSAIVDEEKKIGVKAYYGECSHMIHSIASKVSISIEFRVVVGLDCYQEEPFLPDYLTLLRRFWLCLEC